MNRIITMYLDFAEDQARRRRQMTMAEWSERLDAFLSFNERDVLTHAGRMQAAVAEKLAADREDLAVLEQLEKNALSRKGKKTP